MNNPVLILYLEDNPRDAELVREKLQQILLAYELQITSDRAEYEAALARIRFDLILSDYRLPGYDGLAALALAQEKQPEVPFILISGTLGEEQAVDCMRLGATDYVLKKNLTRLVPAVLRALTEAEEHQKRRDAEHALQESELLLRESQAIAGLGSYVLDISTGLWRSSAIMDQVLGIDEAYDRSVAGWLALIHPDDRPMMADYMNSEVLGRGQRFNKEYRIRRPRDQTECWVHGLGQLEFDSQGHPKKMNGTIQDITPRKQAEQSHARLAMAVEQASEAIVITEPDGTISYVNPAFEKIAGYTREEAVGQTSRILKSGKHDTEFYRQMWEALAAGQVWHGHLINKRKDGTRYEEDATISPVHDAAGNLVNYVAVKRDVTHEAELENQLRQAQKMESIGRLAGGVAHDFNNLLMGIMGYAELCRGRIEPSHPIREYLDEITGGAQRSADITRQLLAFARKQIIAPKILYLNDAVAGMLNLLRQLIGEGIPLVWRPGADLRPIKIDPSQIDQILANLCVNARDAITGAGEITLETGNTTLDADYCVAHPEALPGAYVFLAVSDNGCGMDKDTLAKVFEPFFTTKEVGKGTGLGLATVYGIVKQNKGFIYAYSEPGRGTTFKIYLPQVAAKAVETTVIRKAEVPRGRGETLLLVEDEKSLRVTFGLFLETLGYKVLVAETPAEALKLAAGHPGDIDLLLTDVVLPGMDGRQLAERLDSIKSGVKVLFMSGYTADVIAKSGVLNEGVQFLSKPFTHDELARKVCSMLDRSRPRPVQA